MYHKHIWIILYVRRIIDLLCRSDPVERNKSDDIQSHTLPESLLSNQLHDLNDLSVFYNVLLPTYWYSIPTMAHGLMRRDYVTFVVNKEPRYDFGFFLRFMLYPINGWLGRGFLVLRHVYRFPPNSGSIAWWIAGAQRFAFVWLPDELKILIMDN